jgi:hypothetical protein
MRYTGDDDLPDVTEEVMRARLQLARPYTLVILKTGPSFASLGPLRPDGVPEVIWAHGRRNMAMQQAGLLPIVCPVRDGSGVTGVGIFDASPEDVDRAMAEDPGVKAGVFTYEVHPTRSFPGSALPG